MVDVVAEITGRTMPFLIAASSNSSPRNHGRLCGESGDESAKRWWIVWNGHALELGDHRSAPNGIEFAGKRTTPALVPPRPGLFPDVTSQDGIY